jgi:heme oxygenase
MSLKDLTWENHKKAEQTLFMKALFKRKVSKDLWADFIYNKILWYSAIERKADKKGILINLPDIERTQKLILDHAELTEENTKNVLKNSAIDYEAYIYNLEKEDDILAHLYVWHMGDLYGGQIIKNLVPGSSLALQFKDVELLKTNIRTKLKDSMAQEANRAFEWAIKIMNEYGEVYESDLG